MQDFLRKTEGKVCTSEPLASGEYNGRAKKLTDPKKAGSKIITGFYFREIFYDVGLC